METYFDEHQEVHQKPDNVVPVRRLSAYAIVQDESGKLLMVQPTWSTVWELPGGGIEIEESIREGIAREFLEETGYAISIEEHPTYLGERNFFSKGHNTYYKAVILVYSGKVIAKPAPNWKMNGVIENEIAKIEWIDPAILTEQNTHPIFWPAMKRFLARS